MKTQTSFLTRKAVDQLIYKYAPILYFNTAEKYLMTGVDWLLERSNVVDNTTHVAFQATPENLPTGIENKFKYHLELHDSSVKPGDLSTANAYVHAKKVKDKYLDLQFWFLYAYNGPGTARVRSLLFGRTLHVGNSSLAPLGDHQGDWEHITIRIDTTTSQIEKVYFSQHASGRWVDRSKLEWEGDRLVIYSSLNGHASYSKQGPNYTEHRRYTIPYIGTGLVFDLVNTTDKGKSLDCRERHQLVSAEFLPKEERPIEPVWLNFLNRWGKSDEAHLTSAAIRGIIKSAFGPIFSKILEYGTILEPLVELLLTHFVTENQNGPTGPKTKESWLGTED